jgi:hypothetical protein
VKTYQDAVLNAMEDTATTFDLTTTVSYNFSNKGELLAGGPFGFVARAEFDFQSDVTTVLFNGVNLGNADSFRWRHAETGQATAMLKRWRELIEAGLRD